MSEPRTVSLAAIVGRSLYNVRPAGDPAGRDAMAASIAAIGQLQALIVRVAPDHPELFEVDDGGCRWDAMRLLVERDAASPPEEREPWTWNTDVNVLVVNGEAGVARERSLAANVVRRQLHPVEECEAFAAMVADGLAIATIASDFGVPARYVRQRLKLDELSPRVRRAWLAGKISAEAAEVITGAQGHAAQDAILDSYPGGMPEYAIRQVRHALSAKAVRGDAPMARYVGVDAYVAAGGQVDEQLFDTAPLFLDPVLLKSLGTKMLMDLGLGLAERYGFGSVITPDDLPDGERWKWGRVVVQSPAERDELQRLDDEQEVQEKGCGPLMLEAIREKYDGLRQAVEARAIERCTTPQQRAAAAIFMSLDDEGCPVVDFGRTPPEKQRPGPSSSAPPPFAASADPKAAAEPGEAAEPAKPPGKALVNVLDGALSEGFAVLIQQNPWLALTLATAALTAQFNGSPVRLGARSWTCDAADRPKDWPTALAAELAQPQHPRAVLERFAAVVANTIAVDPGSNSNGLHRAEPHQIAALGELVAHTAGAEDYAEVLWDVLDYEAYFAAATRAAILVAIEEAGGTVSDARKLGKDALAAMAVTLCTDRRWLPRELRMPAPGRIAAALPARAAPGQPSLVDAMADALAADGEDLDGETPEPFAFDPQTPDEAISDFLRRQCLRDDERCRIKAQVLFDAFQDRMPQAVVDLLPSMREFGDAIAAAGINKKRLSTGIHYLGLDLRPVTPLKQAAE